jgi:hypothetical protein
MHSRLVGLVVVALVLAVAFSNSVAAADAKVHEGKIVKAEKGQLTMTDKDGKNEHTHFIPADATLTCDGKQCKLEDLKAGYSVKVTTKGDAAQTVTKVEATTKK